jgi:branched-chain amino acid transport system ATP-binding protein
MRALLQHIWGLRMLLELKAVHAFYDKIEALKGISLRVREHAIVSLLGANGAGKTTTVRTIMGLHRSRDNDIRFDDAPIGNVAPHQIVGLGIAMVPERRELFPDMSVVDNLDMGAYCRRDRHDVRRALDWIYTLFPVLAERRKQRAGALSGGQQQMLAIGRSLMSRPRLLLLDEPTLGLAPLLVKQIFAIVQELNRQGITILLIEQNARQALRLAEYGYILENGRIALEGEGALLMQDENVQRSYLGAI